MKKPPQNTNSRHSASILLTRYARRTRRGVENNVEKRWPGERFSSHAGTIGLSVIRRVKWAVFPPRVSYWPVFFSLLLASSTQAVVSAGNASNVYERAVNVALDTVMWVHEQHRGRMTWAELNAEVCRHMKVRRTEPWQR